MFGLLFPALLAFFFFQPIAAFGIGLALHRVNVDWKLAVFAAAPIALMFLGMGYAVAAVGLGLALDLGFLAFLVWKNSSLQSSTPVQGGTR